MGKKILVFIFLSGAREVKDILSAWAPKTVYTLEIQFVIILTSYSGIGPGRNSAIGCYIGPIALNLRCF